MVFGRCECSCSFWSSLRGNLMLVHGFPLSFRARLCSCPWSLLLQLIVFSFLSLLCFSACFLFDPTVDMDVISLGICNLPMTRKPSNMRNLMYKVLFTLYKHLMLLMLLSAVKWCCSVVPVLKIQQNLTSMSNQQHVLL